MARSPVRCRCGNRPKSECRELITVLAAAELFPFRVFYSSHSRQTTSDKTDAGASARATPWLHGSRGVEVYSAPLGNMPQVVGKLNEKAAEAAGGPVKKRGKRRAARFRLCRLVTVSFLPQPPALPRRHSRIGDEVPPPGNRHSREGGNPASFRLLLPVSLPGGKGCLWMAGAAA